VLEASLSSRVPWPTEIVTAARMSSTSLLLSAFEDIQVRLSATIASNASVADHAKVVAVQTYRCGRDISGIVIISADALPVPSFLQ
jgi:hypothetical protein